MNFRRNLIWYLFLAPAVIMLLMFMALPLIQSLELAFYEWNGLRPREYIALENFGELFDDRFFWGALSHTLTSPSSPWSVPSASDCYWRWRFRAAFGAPHSIDSSSICR